MRICVVGAGFAGLAAAERLQREGHEVVVLEARDRVGGRVWSRTLPNGAVVEMGAEFVEHYQTEMVATVERLGLRFAPTGMAYGDREPRGGLPVERATLLAAYDDLIASLADWQPDPNESIADYFARLDLDPAAREAIVARIEISSTQPVSRLAADSLGKSGYAISADESYRVAGGNQGIALALAQRLGRVVHLSTPVEAVEWSDDGIRAHTRSMTVEADVAVIAVPARLMDRVRFDPPLPERKRRAFAGVDYGQAAKLFVPLAEPAPTSAVMSVPGRFWSWTANGAGGEVQPVVSCFAGSVPALEALDVANGPGRWLERLAELRPDLSLELGGALLSTWQDDPWIGASYSTSHAGVPRDFDELVRPIGPLHFAGEHTMRQFSSTMEGALRSGQRAAEEVLTTVAT